MWLEFEILAHTHKIKKKHGAKKYDIFKCQGQKLSHHVMNSQHHKFQSGFLENKQTRRGKFEQVSITESE